MDDFALLGVHFVNPQPLFPGQHIGMTSCGIRQIVKQFPAPVLKYASTFHGLNFEV